jgi:uncharacterized protein involved in outer membrane biogenesis
MPRPTKIAGAKGDHGIIMRLTLRIVAVTLLLAVLAVAAAEMAGWPGLAPRLAAHFAPGLGLTLDPGARVHLMVDPRLLAPSVTVVHEGRTLADARTLALHWTWDDVWQWRRHDAPLRLREVNAEQLDIAWSRDATGRSNWQSGTRPATQPTPLPIIDSLLIRRGSAHIMDAPLQLQADAKFNTEAGGRWQAQVEGVLRGQQLALQAQASAGLALLSAPRGEHQPAQVQATLSQADSRIKFEGTAASLLDARALDGRIEARGPSLADVGRPLGVTLPATRPFKLQGHLQHVTGLWTLGDAQATVGASRLAGDFKYDTRKARPLLSGELRGGPLLLADLGPAVGTDAEPSRAGRVLPDRAMDISSLARMDAALDIHLSALDLGSRAFAPFAPVNARLELQDSLLSLRDLQAGIAGGRLSGNTSLNAREEPPRWQAALQVQGLSLEHWLHKDKNFLTGKLQAEAHVQGQGHSTATLLGSMNGEVSAALRDGSMSHLITELMGLNLAEALGIWLRGDEALALPCARLEGRFKSGVLRPQFAVVDNRDSRIELSGQISLATEELALRVVTHPKDVSPLTLRAPLRVQGTLGDPRVGLEGKALGGRAMAAIALGALSPPAALLAFIEPGEKLPPLECGVRRPAPAS